MLAVSWHDDAGAEFAEAAAYYEEQDDGLGERFIAHAEAAVAKRLSAPLTRAAPMASAARCGSRSSRTR